ncbi:LysR family transcriptional regulator [Paracoccus sp. (in: a-proteobacteria)]|uniref:LysR family transcriptional regulator n=1 Tax=Paracoccus sp. TaxID=267 RepID=UPI003A87EEA1
MTKPITDPLSLDFATLRTLCLVHEAGSFTAAAETLGVNQSAISYTVDRLRNVFHDPLFVREKGRQIATARCLQIIAQVQPMLTAIERLARPEEFDPARARQKLTLACNYYERLLIVPPLVRELRRLAPGIELNVVNSRGIGPERLLSGGADLLIGPYPAKQTGFYVSRLCREDYVCLMDPGHPMAGRIPGIADYLSLDLIDITYEGNWVSSYVAELQARGYRMRPRLMVPSPAGVSRLVQGSSLVATVPRRLAHEIGEGLSIVECPFKGAFDIALVWPPRFHADAMHQWMRGVVIGLRRELEDIGKVSPRSG